MPKKMNNLNIRKYRSIEDMQKTAFLLPCEVGSLLRIGENSLYKLLASDECPFPVVRLTSQTIRIPTRQFFDWYYGAFDKTKQKGTLSKEKSQVRTAGN